MELRELAYSYARGVGVERLMALSGLGEVSLRAIMGCDLFKGLAAEEAKRIADGAE